MLNSDYILSGPKEDYVFKNESLGKYILDCLNRRNPDDVINIDAISNETLTCGKLLEDSIRLSYALKELQVKKDDVIALIAENSIHTFSLYVAAIYAGVVINPLNPSYSVEELRHAFQISKPKVVFCSRTSLQIVCQLKSYFSFISKIILTEGQSKNLITIDDLLKITKRSLKDFKLKTYDCHEQGAIICQSSGTTGLPKGALITHANLLAVIKHWTNSEYVGLKEKEVTIGVVPLFHIFGVILQLATFSASMQLTVMNKFKPELFLKLIEDYKVKQLFIVPTILLFLTNTDLLDIYDISCVEDIVCGGAPIGKELQVKAQQRLGKVTIRQIYGLTETSGACTFQKVGSSSHGNVGNLLPNVLGKVCDPDTNKCLKPFEKGELCFKGPINMKGYIGNEDATKAMFDEDGFCHTGDVGFYDNDETFYIVDRIKELIKYKGFQVAPSELENLILTHPQVRDCGVIGIPNERSGQVPLAYVVVKNNATVSEKDIIKFVSERISVQKHLYGGVRFIDQIPKNPSGKILRRKLLEMFKDI